MEAELKEMRLKYYQTKQENDELRDKIRFFTKEGSVDFTVSRTTVCNTALRLLICKAVAIWSFVFIVQEIEEALMIVKKKKEKGNQDLDFLQKVDDEQNKGRIFIQTHVNSLSTHMTLYFFPRQLKGCS